MSERQDLGFELLLLARRYAEEPGRDLKDQSIILIDQVATYASLRHDGLPEEISTLLDLAMRAATRRDTPGVIHHLEAALTFADEAPRRLPKIRSEPQPAPTRPPQPSSAVATAKSIAQAVDPLLAKLRAKHSDKL